MTVDRTLAVPQAPQPSPEGGGSTLSERSERKRRGGVNFIRFAIHPTPLARSQVYAGRVDLPAMLATLPLQGRVVAQVARGEAP